MRLLFALTLLLATATGALADRVALVMGNGNYRHAKPLKNAANDATDVAKRLREMGFTVFEGIDLPQRDALLLVQKVGQRLTYDDTVLFYFAGHATQLGSQNYIMPVDASPGSENELVLSSISLQSILATLESRAQTRLVILDACRNNPFVASADGSRSADDAARGLFRMDAGVGSFIAYSTEPGNVASDGAGRNSPFTEALLRHIDRPGENIHAIMRRVRADVMEASNNRQIPWENSALIDEVYLAGLPRTADTATGTNTALARPAVTHNPRPALVNETCLSGQIAGVPTRLCTSSVLASQGSNSYGPENLIDDKPETAWVEGVSGTGEGQTLAWEFGADTDINMLYLINGYAKSDRTFTRNARVSSLRVTGSTGAQATLSLRDTMEWQRFDLPGMAAQRWLQLEILGTYPGTHYQDTAISALGYQ
ncbi:MAG: caspase family protein [Roseovarius sp.]